MIINKEKIIPEEPIVSKIVLELSAKDEECLLMALSIATGALSSHSRTRLMCEHIMATINS